MSLISGRSRSAAWPTTECGEAGLFQCVLVGWHLRFGAEQERHVRTVVFDSVGELVFGWRVQCDRLFGEAYDGVDFLAECGVAEHAERTFGGIVDVGERGTSTSRISELPRRLAGRRNGFVRLLAASSTMRELRRVTVSV